MCAPPRRPMKIRPPRPRSRRRRPGLLLAAAAIGFACASPPPPAQLAFVMREPAGIDAKILKQAATGEWCFSQNLIAVTLRPPWRVRLPDTGRAVTQALESVPGANILMNVRVQTRVEQYLLFQRVCSVVIGDAGHVE